MSRSVTIIDYGIGNMLSVSRAFEHCGAEVVLGDSPERIAEAERLVLPGVGAFADGMRGLEEGGLVAPIRDYARTGRPFLGICLGMQMMLEWSDEFGEHPGLGLIAGRVIAVPAEDLEHRPLKIPHIGWSRLERPEGAEWRDSVLEGLGEAPYAYFVHSYMAAPADPAHRLAECRYGGRALTAVIRDGALTGCQFHPEKSGEVGLALLANFLDAAP